ncbi:MAG: class I SAM-dependent methyltransferase [Elusimicrobia bacterium]|nr:class I SAM-dependent methyltransferase [Elusimicrobiota bacterium]
MIGKELVHDDSLSLAEKAYISVFGVPVSGLRIRARRILPVIDGMRFGSLLDVGCGSGIFSMEIAKRRPDARITGIDSDPSLVEKASAIADRAGLSNCSFSVQDVLGLAETAKYDAVLCVDNLEHIEDDLLALKKIYAVLKNGGTGIFHVPGYYRRWLFFGKSVNFDVEGHVRPGYLAEDIKEKLESAGFRITDIHYTYGFLETVTNNISYLVTRARKKNRFLYAPLFPLLNMVAYFGRGSRPAWGAGILIKVTK